ncbi:hypothetical protein D3C77_394340 [compost metagenome]
MRDDQKALLSKATEGLHYCDLTMTTEEAVELKALVRQLQASGQHPVLAGVFNRILEDTWRSEDPLSLWSAPKEQD